MKVITAIAHQYPKITAWIGAVTGWASFDLLRAAQIAAALLAALVSICALILTAPKVIEELKRWFKKNQSGS